MLTSELLTAARDKLLQYGWRQHNFGYPRTPSCAHGAITWIGHDISWSGNRVLSDKTNDARNIMCQVIGESNIIEWNDAPGRTLTDVLDAFEHAIKFAREEEHNERDNG